MLKKFKSANAGGGGQLTAVLPSYIPQGGIID